MRPHRPATAWALCFALCLLAVAAAGAGEPPASAEPPDDAVLATLPFDPATPPMRIIVDLAPKKNTRRMRFMLDTGADTSVVTPRLAREMGVKVNAVRADRPYRRKTVLGRDVQFYVDTRTSDTSSSVGWEYGLVGGDFLAEYVLELDFAGRRVRFLDPKRFEVPAKTHTQGEAVLPLKIVSNRIGVQATLDGHTSDLLLDTGAPWGLLLSGKIARKAGIEFAPVPGFQIFGTVGRAEGHAGEVERFELGPFALEKVPALVSPNGFYNLGFPGDCLLGYDLLAQFLVRIDYPRQRLWLRRDPGAPPLTDPRREARQREGARD
jgi:predicted aspartyl protease